MTYLEILNKATEKLNSLVDKSLDIITVSKPTSYKNACELAKIISKLSPLLGNMIEYTTIDTLNSEDWAGQGEWIRQDPGFPDALFKSDSMDILPGVEIKAWFPFATEITARFRDSEDIFKNNNINVALIAWLPEFILWGKPVIIDVFVVNAMSVARARDEHYFNPPNYLVLEPEDTTARTSNLQQTNTMGYVLQREKSDFDDAKNRAEELAFGPYSTSIEFQSKIRTLYEEFVYRLDTNYAKIDRIGHNGIQGFKESVMNKEYKGKTIKQWCDIISSDNPDDESIELILNMK